jgi:hypothetical protein
VARIELERAGYVVIEASEEEEAVADVAAQGITIDLFCQASCLQSKVPPLL